MEVNLNDGIVQVNSEVLKRISYFEALLRFPSTKDMNEIELEVDCSKSVFQDLVHFVEGKTVHLKTGDITELYNLSTYFSYFELPTAITFECYKYFFLKDYPNLVPWLIEFLSHPNFEEMKNTFSDVHKCLIVNAPPGFRIRKLDPSTIPKEFLLYCQRSQYIPENPKPNLPQYYVVNMNYGRKEKAYYSRSCCTCSDIREALQYFNFQHGNSQSRTGFTKNISCRFIYEIPRDEHKLWLSYNDLSISRIEQRYPSIKAHLHKGNSWDFHLNGGHQRESAVTISGHPQDILMFFRNEKQYNITKLSMRVHMGYFNRVFQYCSSIGYDADSNSIFFIRSVFEIKKVLKILISDESTLVKNLCSRLVYLSYYPQPDQLPI
jgi:hypothetical protein